MFRRLERQGEEGLGGETRSLLDLSSDDNVIQEELCNTQEEEIPEWIVGENGGRSSAYK